jgi:quinoprotein glucose dehydrogenase
MHRVLVRAALPVVCGLAVVLPLLPSPARGDDPAKPYSPFVAGASKEGEQAIKRFRLPPGLKAELFAAEPLVANIVAFNFDEKGRCFVAETFRLHKGVTDDRSHMDWLDDDMASRTVADRVAMYRKYAKDKFHEYETEHDRVRLVEDTDGDGVADKASVFADGFHDAATGIGAGVLARKGNVYYTCIPDVWLLRDTKGTGTADFRQSLHTGYGVHVAFLGHDLHGLKFGPDGKLYFSSGDRGLNVKTLDGKTVSVPDCGSVLRCDPDGTNLEVVATGLRNPQCLAFDDHGNLFTGDNNSDSGDAARWVYIVEGGDSGWRTGYQYGSDLSDRGPFNAEKIWHLPPAEQPAYIVPPLAHIANGPSGLCYYPGTGLPDKYAGHFFLCDFRGSGGGSGVWSFAVKPKGAAFELVDKHEFVWGVLATDCQFGPDGFYVSDWTEGWGLTGKGRIYRIGDPEMRKGAAVQEVKKLLAEGFDQRPAAELGKLLEHSDQRVRQEAQFALAVKDEQDAAKLAVLKDVALTGKNPLARLHAIWALGQRRAVQPLAALLNDPDAEVRAQAAKVLGEGKEPSAFTKIVALLEDPDPRVRFFAAQSLGKYGKKEAVQPLLKLLRGNADQDAYLRHAAVHSLSRIDDRPALVAAAKDDSVSVRLGALLALRRLESPDVALFLNDSDARIVLEAARAINDVAIAYALPQLAALVGRSNPPDLLGYRVLNAHFRLGQAENAAALAAFAARPDASEKLRVEAVKMLGEWAKPARRDHVTGLTQSLLSRPQSQAADALQTSLGGIFSGPDGVRKEAASVAAKLGIKEVGPALLEMVSDKKLAPAIRVETLRALAALKDERVPQAMKLALGDDDPRLRTEGRRILARTQPDEAVNQAKAVLEKGPVAEQQGALSILAEMKGAAADDVLAAWMKKLLAGQVAPEIHLDLLEAAGKRPAENLKKLLAEYEGQRSKDDHLAKYRESLVGGDADAGRKVFYYKAEVTCLKCHKINGEGGEVGPDLAGIGTKQNREYILESIVDPNKQIAKGYETAVLTLTNGQVVTGIVKAETAKELQLMTPEGKLVTVPRDKIDDRQTGKSAMPEDVIKSLSKAELRDLVEFLAGLKEAPPPK